MNHQFCVLFFVLISTHCTSTTLVHCRELQANMKTREGREQQLDEAPSAGVGFVAAGKDSLSRPPKSLDQQVVVLEKDQVYKIAATGPSRKGSGH